MQFYSTDQMWFVAQSYKNALTIKHTTKCTQFYQNGIIETYFDWVYLVLLTIIVFS